MERLQPESRRGKSDGGGGGRGRGGSLEGNCKSKNASKKRPVHDNTLPSSTFSPLLFIHGQFLIYLDDSDEGRLPHSILGAVLRVTSLQGGGAGRGGVEGRVREKGEGGLG